MPLDAYEEMASRVHARRGWSVEQRARDDAAMLRNYAACFETAAGREVLRDLQQYYLFRLTPIEADPMYEKGQRSVVLALLQAIDNGRHVPSTQEDV